MENKIAILSLILNVVIICVMVLYMIWSMSSVINLRENQREMVKEEVVSYLEGFDIEIIE